MKSNLAQTVFKLRLKHKLLSKELAEICLISPTSVSKIQNGSIRPSPEVFRRLYHLLGKTKKQQKRLINAYLTFKAL